MGVQNRWRIDLSDTLIGTVPSSPAPSSDAGGCRSVSDLLAGPSVPLEDPLLVPDPPLQRQPERPGLVVLSLPLTRDLLELEQLRLVNQGLVLEEADRLIRLHQPQEKYAQERGVARGMIGLSPQPCPYFFEAGGSDLVDLLPARAGPGLPDQLGLGEPSELRIDLAVAGRPHVQQRTLEPAVELVPGHRGPGEQAEQRMAARFH